MDYYSYSGRMNGATVKVPFIDKYDSNDQEPVVFTVKKTFLILLYVFSTVRTYL